MRTRNFTYLARGPWSPFILVAYIPDKILRELGHKISHTQHPHSCDRRRCNSVPGQEQLVPSIYMSIVAIGQCSYQFPTPTRHSVICMDSNNLTFCRHIGKNTLHNNIWFTNCVLLFDKSLILGCLWPLISILNNTLILGIWCSTIPHPWGYFCPWTFFENIGFNTVLTNPFMSHLATQLGYYAGVFQALQLIVLATFGVVD